MDWPTDWLGAFHPLLSRILIGFALLPSPFGELVRHLITQVKICLLFTYITVFDPKRGNHRYFIPFLVYDLVYPSIYINLATLATLSPWSDSVRTHTCFPFLRKPLLRWHMMFETWIIINCQIALNIFGS